jgi:hypothetical protein
MYPHPCVAPTWCWPTSMVPLELGETDLASIRADNPREAMQGYLDWAYGLVDQLGRDGTHGFQVI